MADINNKNSTTKEAVMPDQVDLAPGRNQENKAQVNPSTQEEQPKDDKKANTATFSQEGNTESFNQNNETQSDASSPDDVEKIESEEDILKKAQEEIEDLRNSWARERAEFMNFRKRTQQERQKQIGDTIATFVQDLLPAFDNLDQVISITTDNSEVKKYIDGVSMIRDNFFQILSNKNIKVLQPTDADFDPQLMEAISSEERKGLKKDVVLEVYQSGYYLEDDDGSRQLLRPARVRVGKAKVE